MEMRGKDIDNLSKLNQAKRLRTDYDSNKHLHNANLQKKKLEFQKAIQDIEKELIQSN